MIIIKITERIISSVMRLVFQFIRQLFRLILMVITGLGIRNLVVAKVFAATTMTGGGMGLLSFIS